MSNPFDKDPGFNFKDNTDLNILAHRKSDVDISRQSLHHTLGHKPTQAAPGDELAALQEIVNGMLLKVYPIGAIYMSVSNTDPGTLFGGVWVAWGSGRVPVGVNAADVEFDTVEETGGEKSHVLTTPELPSHNHSIDHDHASVTVNKTVNYRITGALSGSATEVTDIGGVVGAAGSNSVNLPIVVDLPNYAGNSGNTGAGTAHNNLQPYITCYMWKRTA